jgi:uncharacterized damage-inducible protein DinB
MEIKQYLKETFSWNTSANKKVLEKIALLPDKLEAIKFMSHLVNCQFKWMARIKQDPKAHEMSWWDPLYNLDELSDRWDDSMKPWFELIETETEKELNTEVTFIGFDGGIYAATPVDIALQLNYHSIHHRAQIQTIIRQQGLTPDFVDYIATKYRKL